jgi:hypothetical protein
MSGARRTRRSTPDGKEVWVRARRELHHVIDAARFAEKTRIEVPPPRHADLLA